ncbi:MAG: thrombospondin type 3 repeat family [Cytophagaceae bacterium]|jgi:hypothetical protein|nr:thrombospondin type 3 repeat family [Cytophagaceae bacterium]
MVKMTFNIFHMKSNIAFSIKTYIVLLSVLWMTTAYSQVTGDYRSKASGDWANTSTWEVYNGSAWVNATAVPDGTNESDANNVYLEAGYTVTMSATQSCKNLNLNATADVIRINTQENILNVWGKLRFYTGTAPGTSTTTLAGVAGWISTGSTDGTGAGRIRFRGTADRAIIINGEVNANATSTGYHLEFAFDAGKRATIDYPIRAGYVTVLSGILKVNPVFSLRVSGDGLAAIAGTMTVKSGATLIGGQFFKGSSDPMLLFTLESGAFLYFENTGASLLATQTAIINGTVGLIGSTTAFPLTGGRVGAAPLTTFNDLIISGTGVKALQHDITVNGKLSLGGTASIDLNSKVLSYGTTGALEYNGTTAQTTTSVEFPVTNGPGRLIINNPLGLTLHASRAIEGSLTLSNGLFKLGNNDFTLNENSPAVAGVASASNMVVTNGSGSLRKVFSTAGTYLFPIGENTGTPEYSWGQVTVNSADLLDGTKYVGLRVINSNHPAAAALTDKISRYWAVTTNTTNVNYNVTLQYLVNDVSGTETAIKSHYYADETASSAGATNAFTNAVTHRISYIGLTNAGFVTGMNECMISNNSVDVPSVTSYCSTSGIIPAFTASTPTVTGTATYQWQLSADGGAFSDIGSNGQNKDYSVPTALSAGVYKYRRLVGDPSSCLASEANISNEITVTVYPDITGNVIGSDQTVISGNTASTLSFTGILAGGTGSYAYQWKYSAVQGGPYTDVIADGNASTYDPGILTSSIYFICDISSGDCSASSNEVSLLVPICSITDNSISALSSTNECSSSSPSLDGSSAIVTSGTPVYQWQESVDGGAFADVATNGQSEDYTSAVVSSGLYKYRRIVSDPLSCQPANTSLSNEVTITVIPEISGNTIGSDQSIITGDPADILTGTGTITGGDGTYTYQWQSSSSQGGPYTDVAIGDGTLADYDPTNPSATVYLVRNVLSGSCTDMSNEIKITVSPVTGIEDDQNPLGINLFPNPVNDALLITINGAQSVNGNLNVMLVNNLGIVVYENNIPEGTKQLSADLSKLTQGIYFVNFIQEGKSVSTYKVVKR